MRSLAPSPRRSTVALAATLLAIAGPRLAAQDAFRASLTATVMISPEDSAGKPAAGPSALGCRHVTLRWSALAGAGGYAVYVSPRSTGPWAALPPRNVCGAVRFAAPTTAVDVEPTLGAPAVVRHLYYKVVALAAPSAPTGARVLDVTEPVAVEFP